MAQVVEWSNVVGDPSRFPLEAARSDSPLGSREKRSQIWDPKPKRNEGVAGPRVAATFFERT